MTGFWVSKWLGESPPNFPCNIKRFWAKMFSGESSEDVLSGNIRKKNTLCWYLVSSLKQPPTRQVKQIINSLQKQILWKIERFMVTYLQTQHVYSTLKRRGNDRFQVFSTWNTRGGFVGYLKLKCWNYQSYDKDSMGFYQISREVWMNHP